MQRLSRKLTGFAGIRITLKPETSKKKSNRICRIASGRIRRIVSILSLKDEI